MTDCRPAETNLIAARFAALSHPARISILRHLAQAQCCCCKDVVEQLDLAQSTVSQHLKILVEAGLVRLSPEGQRSLYEIDRDALAGFSASFATLVEDCCSASPANTETDNFGR
ncbi:ArsR family transcriptional regulator [Pseudaminobacter arsenicus]|uniref:ArsR family transcriptional regulator n=1 Tax=Borborobacter arsenicus TaxID=1851146 RepID=A0A432V2I0_9HYPH|nr:metalloregulator ArsR/SmtB family transcription factor [Pseudaminobacter arsenicus]RUM96414.1 ArsR family transcriptional regulator [Pseudaminobacter arsenicus]